ncbi:hypothetical protein PVAP13_4KG137700 [Panicum virgatum]|uniref:Oleosin n=1 Tax=Panicum virgatum TaxID=38727 RepID=A0A8T0TR62_PANVG|nr:hypothetical protein PVAP13_4KG137700 [Panicum virgatum]
MATASARAHGGDGHQQQPPPQPHGLRYEPLRRMQGLDLKAALRASSPRAPTVATAALLVPLGGALLGASGLALAATLAGLALAAPLLVLFSPVIVPAALAAALAVSGFLAAGGLGVAGVSALARMAGRRRQRRGARRDGGAAAGPRGEAARRGRPRGVRRPPAPGHRYRLGARRVLGVGGSDLDKRDPLLQHVVDSCSDHI